MLHAEEKIMNLGAFRDILTSGHRDICLQKDIWKERDTRGQQAASGGKSDRLDRPGGMLTGQCFLLLIL